FGTLLNFPELRDRIPSIVEELSAGKDAALQETVADLEAMIEERSRHPLSAPSLPLVMLISASENNPRPGLSRETVEAEEEGALFTSAIPGFLVDSPVPRYGQDKWFGSTPSSLPRTLVIHGTLDPNTAYAGARAHAEALDEEGQL
ncbi:alpha/beta hydrolase, partial [Lysobacter sp. D1-1-M9]